MLNGYSVNGAYLPTWVVRAAVVAAAAAAVVTVAPQRILMATAYGDARVVVTLTETQVVAARATGTAGVTSTSVTPRIVYSGAVDADAAATGYALVVRVVQATAGGDAYATGTALPNAKLGEALATAASTVVVCDAHRVRPGASFQPVGATADPIASLVTRSPLLPTVTQAVATGRGEASLKLNGESFFRHDGYVLTAMAVCTPTIDQEKTKLIASFGSFDYATGTGASTAFVRHRALASGTGVTTPQAVVATRTARATATAPAVATATVDGTRVRLAQASGNGIATRVLLRPAQRFAAASSSNAFLNEVQAVAVRQARGTVLAQSTAYQAEIFFGRQHKANGGGNAFAYGIVGGTTLSGTASSIGLATGSATTATQHYADASGGVLALAGTATTGNQLFGAAEGVGIGGSLVTETFNPGARGFATATGTGTTAEFQRATASGDARLIGSATPANQFYANAAGTATGTVTADGTFNPGARGFATAIGVRAVGSYTYFATATGAIARATGVFVNARTVSDNPAPEERQMSVSGEDRGMLVPAEDRTMVVSA